MKQEVASLQFRELNDHNYTEIEWCNSTAIMLDYITAILQKCIIEPIRLHRPVFSVTVVEDPQFIAIS